ncbi:MAG: hypothetical protein EPN91_10855 [Salinibacterium sp.]|nr:MAG: hypothetical protein EPN91_10855 [Salinibacterium sp.]
MSVEANEACRRLIEAIDADHARLVRVELASLNLCRANGEQPDANLVGELVLAIGRAQARRLVEHQP